MFDYLPGPLRDVAAAQAGVVSRADAAARGVGDAVIRRAVQRGRWRRIHPRVYSVSPAPLTSDGRLWAALLYAGTGATLSHETAAELWGLEEPRGVVVHVTIPVARRVRSLSAIRIHYAHRLPTSRHPTRNPPVTRVEETVLDLIDRAPDIQEVVTWLVRSCQRRLTSPEQLVLALEARKKIRWRGEGGGHPRRRRGRSRIGARAVLSQACRTGTRTAERVATTTTPCRRPRPVLGCRIRGLRPDRGVGRQGRARRGGCVP